MKHYTTLITCVVLLAITVGCSAKNTDPLQVAPANSRQIQYCEQGAWSVYNLCLVEARDYQSSRNSSESPLTFPGPDIDNLIPRFNTVSGLGAFAPNRLCKRAYSDIRKNSPPLTRTTTLDACLLAIQEANTSNAELQRKIDDRQSYFASVKGKAISIGLLVAVFVLPVLLDDKE